MPDIPISNFVTSVQEESLGTISVLINLPLHRMAQTAAVSIEAASVFSSCLWSLRLLVAFPGGTFLF